MNYNQLSAGNLAAHLDYLKYYVTCFCQLLPITNSDFL